MSNVHTYIQTDIQTDFFSLNSSMWGSLRLPNNNKFVLLVELLTVIVRNHVLKSEWCLKARDY